MEQVKNAWLWFMNKKPQKVDTSLDAAEAEVLFGSVNLLLETAAFPPPIVNR